MAQLALAPSLDGLLESAERIQNDPWPTQGDPKATPDDPKATKEAQKATPGDPKATTEGQKATPDDPKVTAEGQRATPDDPKVTAEGRKPTPDDPKVTPDDPRPATEAPRFLLEAAKTAGAAKEGTPTDDVTSPIGMVELLIRSPARFLDQVHQPDLLPLVRTLLATIVVGAGAFGAVVGTFRGGVQVGYCAIKVPLLLVGTLAVCTPSFIGLARAFGTGIPAREVVVVSLGAAARFALVLAGLAPVVWLVEGGASYHQSALLITAVCALAGVSASGLLFRGLSRVRGSGLLVGLAFVTVFGVVGGQTSWLLRPFLVRPRTVSVPFVRGIEGDLFDAVRGSARSAAGIYDEDHSP
jgi:hypothetical protein